MEKESKKKFPLKGLLRVTLLVICGLILGFNIYLANAGGLVGNKLPMPFGCGVSVVLSGSMEPSLSKGDLIVVTEAESYEVNDVVVFQDMSALVVHRIVSVEGDTVTTKGDANNAADEPISVSAIKGRVRFSVPFVGTVIDFIKTPIGTAGIILAAILLVELPRRKEKKKDEEERQRILDEIRKLREED